MELVVLIYFYGILLLLVYFTVFIMLAYFGFTLLIVLFCIFWCAWVICHNLVELWCLGLRVALRFWMFWLSYFGFEFGCLILSTLGLV